MDSPPEPEGSGSAAPGPAGRELTAPPSPLVMFIATGCYSGMIPWASGTFGTALGLAILLIPGVRSPWILVPLIIAGFWAGVVTSKRVADWTGHRLSRSAALAKSTFQKEHAPETADPSIVVIDEIVGMWITLLWVPFSPAAGVIGFLAFRAMDIIKPEPARRAERIPNGWGIMLDDVVAGVYANIFTQLVVRFVWPG